MKMQALAMTMLMLVVPAVTSCTRSETHAQLGTVTSMSDSGLERLQNKAWNSLQQGSKLFAGDRLRASGKGYVVITLDKVGRFLIENGSEYELGKDAADFRSILHQGSVWYYSLMPGGSRMNISTGNAVAGARGTAFSVTVSEHGTDVCTCDGTVDFAAVNGAAYPVPAGRFSMIRKGASRGEVGDAKHLLAQTRKGDQPEYDSCLRCHRDPKRPLDVTLQS